TRRTEHVPYLLPPLRVLRSEIRARTCDVSGSGGVGSWEMDSRLSEEGKQSNIVVSESLAITENLIAVDSEHVIEKGRGTDEPIEVDWVLFVPEDRWDRSRPTPVHQSLEEGRWFAEACDSRCPATVGTRIGTFHEQQIGTCLLERLLPTLGRYGYHCELRLKHSGADRIENR